MRSFLIATILVAFVLPASAQEKVKIASVAPTGTPWAKIVQRLKKDIEKKTDKYYKVRVYLGQKLGDEMKLVSKCQQGKLQMIGVSTGAIASVVPELNAYELPYLFNSYAQADKALDATFATAEQILADAGFTLYFWSENGYRDFATKQTFVRGPSDLKGMKMRAQESFVHTSMYKALGAIPNTIPVSQVAEDLANNVVSGYDNTWLYSHAAQWTKHVKYITLSHHIYQPAVILYNKAWLDAQPPEKKAVLLAKQKKHTKKGREMIRALASELRGSMEADGLKFHEPTAGERAKMISATKSVYDTFRKRVGARGSALLDEIMKNR